jgi:anti-sigma factor RsiW
MESMSWLFREPRRDPEVGEALRRSETESSRQEDMEALRRRIMAAAAPTLAELRSPAPRWWEWISRWSAVALPAGLAAIVAAGLLVPGTADLTNPVESEVIADSTLMITALAGEPVGGELAASLIVPGTSDWLWQQAVTR